MSEIKKPDDVQIKITEVARGVLEDYVFEKIPNNTDDMTGFCALGAMFLAKLFRLAGYAADAIHGRYRVDYGTHYWTNSGDYIFDITASQFELPKVYIQPQYPENYKAIEKSELDYRHLHQKFAEWGDVFMPTTQKIEMLVKKFDLRSNYVNFNSGSLRTT